MPLILIIKIIKGFQQHKYVIVKPQILQKHYWWMLNPIPLSKMRFNIFANLFTQVLTDSWTISSWTKLNSLHKSSKYSHIKSQIITDVRRIVFTFSTAYAIHFNMSFSSGLVDYAYCRFNLIFCNRMPKTVIIFFYTNLFT